MCDYTIIIGFLFLIILFHSWRREGMHWGYPFFVPARGRAPYYPPRGKLNTRVFDFQ